MYRKKKLMKWGCIVLLVLFFVVGIIFVETMGQKKKTEQAVTENGVEETVSDESARYQTDGNLPIHDNSSLYEDEDWDGVTVMYLTVREGNKANGTNHSWTEVNEHSAYYYEENGIERYSSECILQVGDENGPVVGEFGYDSKVPNATVSIRGQSSTRRAVKNYKISIKDGKGSLDEQTVINLNKHLADGVRYRNKLCYELMQEVPGMMSARTRFVHLYVKDETEGGSGEFEDYGLYTQVEQLSKRYLKNHGLDKNGQLYKINFFEFYRYEDVIKLRTDSDYDEVAFEDRLEIKGDTDHSKLIEMLEDVNDYTIPIEEVFSKWFDEENFFSWLSFHILVGNKDTQSRNTFIYSPLNVDKWYFISWDNDASFMAVENELQGWHDGESWDSGVSNYWGNVLISRVLKSEYYRQLLDEKIEEVKGILTEELVTEKIAEYREITTKYLFTYPDVVNSSLTEEEERIVSESIPKEIEKNYNDYKESYNKPMPFYIGVPENRDGTFYIQWDSAYDFNEESIQYTIEIDDSTDFSDPIICESGLYYNSFETDMLPAGQYYVRLKAKNESGYEQYAFDYVVGDNGKIYGMKSFWVMEDGTILEDGYEDD